MAENAKPGTTAWHLGRRGAEHAIEGFADRTDVAPGQSFGLYVSTTAGRWRVSAYRIGWYGGKGGRAVWTSPWQQGHQQRGAIITGSSRTVRAPWHRSLNISTTSWPAGSYLLKLTSSAADHRYVPVTVRSASVRGQVVIVNEQFTWEAYNEWGGRSLYTGPGGYAGRSLRVTFDRPYDRGGAYKFQEFEQALIQRAERLGLAIAYTTDVYLSDHRTALVGATAVVSPGHDEYWTWNERQAYLAARSHGSNLAFFGANAQYWQVRLASTSHGRNRDVICYKTDVGRDPATRTDPERRTTRWRDLPRPRPESGLVGMMYECYPAAGDLVVRTPTFFAYAGTGARSGSRYPGLIGIEIDRVYAGRNTPRPIQVVSHSRASCRGVTTYSDSTYHVARSRAGVFATGTMRWTQALGGSGRSRGVTTASIRFVRKVTDNVLRAFAVGPAGIQHPAHDNLASVHPPTRNRTGAA